MLMLVATAHFLSWLPLNVVNLIGKKVGSRIRWRLLEKLKKNPDYHLEIDLFFTYIVDLHYTEGDTLFINEEHMRITYAICHLASMSSAITNPFLYGYMNENFR